MNPLKNITKLIFVLTALYLPVPAQTVPDSVKTTANDEQKAAEYRLHNDWANLDYYRDDNKKLSINKQG